MLCGFYVVAVLSSFINENVNECVGKSSRLHCSPLQCAMNVKREDTRRYILSSHKLIVMRMRAGEFLTKSDPRVGFGDATLKAPRFIKKFSLFYFICRDFLCSKFYDTQDDSREYCMQVSFKEKRRIHLKNFFAAEMSEQKISPSTCH